MCEPQYHKNYSTHFYKHLNDLKLTSTSALQILELIQYTVLYTVVSLYIGTFVDALFYHETVTDISTPALIGHIILHMIVSVLSIYYIRKIVQLVPFIWESSSQPPHCGVLEFEGELGIGVIFIATQRNLFINVQEFVRRMNR